jgi:hypothetical protein
MGRRKAERPGLGHEIDKPGAGPPEQAKQKLLLLTVIAALLVLLFDFTAIGGL